MILYVKVNNSQVISDEYSCKRVKPERIEFISLLQFERTRSFKHEKRRFSSAFFHSTSSGMLSSVREHIIEVPKHNQQRLQQMIVST